MTPANRFLTGFSIFIIVGTIGGYLLSGDGPSYSEKFKMAEETAKKKMSNPVITEVTTNVDGCKVSYVDRGHDYNSFYLAKCEGNSATTTQNWTYRYGKGQTMAKRRTAIELSAEIDSLTKEREETKKLESALSKLSEEDKKTLGLVTNK